MKALQGQNSGGSGKKKSKFGNVRVVDEEYGAFDSKHEHRVFQGLLLRARAGEIRDLKRQVRFKFGRPDDDDDYIRTESGRPLVYTADFTYDERVGDDWRYVVSDAKGAKTKEYLIKKALMRYFYNIDIHEC